MFTSSEALGPTAVEDFLASLRENGDGGDGGEGGEDGPAGGINQPARGYGASKHSANGCLQQA